MIREFEKTCQAEVMESLSTMDKRDLVEESFKAMNEVQEALSNVARIIQEKKRYLIAADFSIVVALGCLGTPDVHNSDRDEPDKDNGVVPIKFIVGTEDNCIALTNILTAQIFGARNREE